MPATVQPTKPRFWSKSRIGIAIVMVALLPLLFVGGFLSKAAWSDRDERVPLVPGTTNDASGLESTELRGIHRVEGEFDAAVEDLRALLRHADEQGVPLSIGGARHSMGGQSIAPGGVQIDMLPFCAMQLDAEQGVLTVQAGARWVDVIHYLDPLGFSPEVMQSNSDFSVGGSISVNCHGWQPASPPIASTVRSLRLMTASGEVLRCSAQQNPELFSLVLGGYGLFGVILDVELSVVRNVSYAMRSEVLSQAEFLAAFPPAAEETPQLGLLFGRLNIVPGSRFDDAVLGRFLRVDEPPKLLTEVGSPSFGRLRRTVFRASVGSGFGKRLRWTLEKAAMRNADGRPFTRNSLLIEPADVYGNRKVQWTDILHEYFVPKARLAEFLTELRAALDHHAVDLLNVTVRDVREDTVTVLRYADEDVIALVMLFSMRRDRAADRVMESFTKSAIDSVLKHDGCFYLPYRLHASPAQFARAYPMAASFFQQKRRYDPAERFVNRLYLRYGRHD